MNLKQLEYFVRVAEIGSFSQAAMVLNVAQPALSHQVRLLEAQLHVALLIRNGRGVTLTEVGNRLCKHSVAILQLVERAAKDIEAAPSHEQRRHTSPALGHHRANRPQVKRRQSFHNRAHIARHRQTRLTPTQEIG
jgi:DNA-binding transcriptional LysR family regulator